MNKKGRLAFLKQSKGDTATTEETENLFDAEITGTVEASTTSADASQGMSAWDFAIPKAFTDAIDLASKSKYIGLTTFDDTSSVGKVVLSNSITEFPGGSSRSSPMPSKTTPCLEKRSPNNKKSDAIGMDLDEMALHLARTNELLGSELYNRIEVTLDCDDGLINETDPHLIIAKHAKHRRKLFEHLKGVSTILTPIVKIFTTCLDTYPSVSEKADNETSVLIDTLESLAVDLQTPDTIKSKKVKSELLQCQERLAGCITKEAEESSLQAKLTETYNEEMRQRLGGAFDTYLSLVKESNQVQRDIDELQERMNKLKKRQSDCLDNIALYRSDVTQAEMSVPESIKRECADVMDTLFTLRKTIKYEQMVEEGLVEEVEKQRQTKLVLDAKTMNKTRELQERLWLNCLYGNVAKHYCNVLKSSALKNLCSIHGGTLQLIEGISFVMGDLNLERKKLTNLAKNLRLQREKKMQLTEEKATYLTAQNYKGAANVSVTLAEVESRIDEYRSDQEICQDAISRLEGSLELLDIDIKTQWKLASTLIAKCQTDTPAEMELMPTVSFHDMMKNRDFSVLPKLPMAVLTKTMADMSNLQYKFDADFIHELESIIYNDREEDISKNDVIKEVASSLDHDVPCERVTGSEGDRNGSLDEVDIDSVDRNTLEDPTNEIGLQDIIHLEDDIQKLGSIDPISLQAGSIATGAEYEEADLVSDEASGENVEISPFTPKILVAKEAETPSDSWIEYDANNQTCSPNTRHLAKKLGENFRM